MTQKELKNILKYCPKTGNFIWKITSSNRATKNKIAGCSNFAYTLIGYNKKIYRAHRLAFLYMKGYIPDLIDHKDRNGLNNKWSNLREANKSLNNVNSKLNKVNKSGYTGVSFKNDCKRKKPWRSVINANGKQISLGYFRTAKEASLAYNKASVKYYKEFANLNKGKI